MQQPPEDTTLIAAIALHALISSGNKNIEATVKDAFEYARCFKAEMEKSDSIYGRTVDNDRN